MRQRASNISDLTFEDYPLESRDHLNLILRVLRCSEDICNLLIKSVCPFEWSITVQPLRQNFNITTQELLTFDRTRYDLSMDCTALKYSKCTNLTE